MRRMRPSDSVARMADYDVDFYAWTRRQRALLRRLGAGERVNDADLDWPNMHDLRRIRVPAGKRRSGDLAFV